MKSFNEILSRLKSIEGTDKNKDIANIFDVAASTLSSWKNRNTIPYRKLIAYCESNKVSLDWLLTGRGSKYIKASGEAGGQVKDRSISHISSQEAKVSRNLDQLIERYQEEKKELERIKKSVDNIDKKYKTILVKLQKLDDEDLKTIDKLIDKFLD